MTLPIDQTLVKFNRYHHSSTYQKVQYNDHLAAWFQSKVDADEWRLFTCTVVFKPIDRVNTQSRYEDEYRGRFLNKVRRRLERSSIHQPKTIPYEGCFFYERYEKSRLKIAGRCNPPHIHSIIPIRTEQVHRFCVSGSKQTRRLLLSTQSSCLPTTASPFGQTAKGGVYETRYSKHHAFEKYAKYFDLINFDDCYDSKTIRNWKHQLFAKPPIKRLS